MFQNIRATNTKSLNPRSICNHLPLIFYTINMKHDFPTSRWVAVTLGSCTTGGLWITFEYNITVLDLETTSGHSGRSRSPFAQCSNRHTQKNMSILWSHFFFWALKSDQKQLVFETGTGIHIEIWIVWVCLWIYIQCWVVDHFWLHHNHCWTWRNLQHVFSKVLKHENGMTYETLQTRWVFKK